jgi:hypothetical protein
MLGYSEKILAESINTIAALENELASIDGGVVHYAQNPLRETESVSGSTAAQTELEKLFSDLLVLVANNPHSKLRELKAVSVRGVDFTLQADGSRNVEPLVLQGYLYLLLEEVKNMNSKLLKPGLHTP